MCKEPPYKVEESGYAGFIMPIEVYFKNKVGSWNSSEKDSPFTKEEVELGLPVGWSVGVPWSRHLSYSALAHEGRGWGTGLLGRRVGVHVDVAFSGSSRATSPFSCPAGVCGP